MAGSELLLEYLSRYFPVLVFVFVALAFGADDVLDLLPGLRIVERFVLALVLDAVEGDDAFVLR